MEHREHRATGASWKSLRVRGGSWGPLVWGGAWVLPRAVGLSRTPCPGHRENLEDFPKLASGVPSIDTGMWRLGKPKVWETLGWVQGKLRSVGLTCLCSILSWPRMNCKTQERVGEASPARHPPSLPPQWATYPHNGLQ